MLREFYEVACYRSKDFNDLKVIHPFQVLVDNPYPYF